MTKKIASTILGMFLFFYILNYLTPLSFGDDYLYCFVWQGNSEFDPLTENAVRVSSLRDLFISQYSHYFTWSGRTVSHILVQLFLWAGKDIFNIFNAAISVLLVMEIYWIADKGKLFFEFKLSRLCWIGFMLWSFVIGFSQVFFWLSGACNYLWTTVFLLAFLLPYIRKFYFFEDTVVSNTLYTYLIFLGGIIAGWTNENSICWIILILFVFIYAHRNSANLENWMMMGLGGLIIGYALLMLAPGNAARLHEGLGDRMTWLTAKLLKQNLAMWIMVLLFQFILWYFTLRSLFIIQKRSRKDEDLTGITAEIVLIKILCLVSFFMTASMLLSPSFPPRSSFPGTVQLVIAACILLRLQDEYKVRLINVNARKFLCVVSLLYFMVTSSATIYGFWNYNNQIKSLLAYVKHSVKTKENIITVQAIKPLSKTLYNMSGLHLLYYEMSDDENFWRNVAFSRYYGIKGIRMIKNSESKE